VDNKPIGGPNEPRSLGDMFAFSSALRTRANKRAGTLYATCVVATGGTRDVMQCNGTFALQGGQLSAIALMRDQKVTHIAIVGGTGAYEGARGQVTAVSRGENSPYSDDTFHLLSGASELDAHRTTERGGRGSRRAPARSPSRRG
jgi:hypothetical protein